MLVIRNLNKDNSIDRVDILGLSKDDFYLIEKGIESLLKTQDGYNPNRIYSLLRNLNDNGTFLLNSKNNIPMYSQQEVNNEFVDLGLPSGTLWATCNVGATSPEQTGLYFAFGETEGFTAEQVENGTKKFNKTSYKAKKIKSDLTLEQDAARANLGGNWRMPTDTDFEELINNTTQTWTDNYNGTGVAGKVFTSKVNGNSVFFPAAGYCRNTSVSSIGSYGYYWSASGGALSLAWYLRFDSGFQSLYYDYRYYGQPVRGVCKR